MVTESHGLGFNDFPEEVETILASHDWDEPKKLNRLRMGTVLTLATEIPYHGGSYRFVVDKFDSGREVALRYPGRINNGFDFQIRVQGWVDKGAPTPKHDHIYSDFYHKRETSSTEAFNALCEAALDIHSGDGADTVLDRYSGQFEFTEGRTAEALLRPLPWIFIEQDIRFWYGDGRDRTIGTIRSLCDGGSKDEIGDFQTLDEINRTELAIPNQS